MKYTFFFIYKALFIHKITKLFSLSHCMKEIILKVIYFERGLSKSLKKVNFIFQ